MALEIWTEGVYCYSYSIASAYSGGQHLCWEMPLLASLTVDNTCPPNTLVLPSLCPTIILLRHRIVPCSLSVIVPCRVLPRCHAVSPRKINNKILPGIPLSSNALIFPSLCGALFLLCCHVVPCSPSVIVSRRVIPGLCVVLLGRPLIAPSLVFVPRLLSSSPVVVPSLVVVLFPPLSTYLKKTRWVGFSLVGLRYNLFSSSGFLTNGCAHNCPLYRSQRHCSGLVGCRNLLGSLGVEGRGADALKAVIAEFCCLRVRSFWRTM